MPDKGPRTQSQIDADNAEVAHRAANPPASAVPRSGEAPFGEPAKNRFDPPARPLSPVPGDIFNERGSVPTRSTKKTGPLPADFPGRLQLVVAGFPTYETARTIVQLSAIAGLDGRTQKAVAAALADGPTGSDSFSTSTSVSPS